MRYIKTLIERSMLMILIFFFVYPVHFVFAPMSTRMFISFLGCIALVCSRKLVIQEIKPLCIGLIVMMFSFLAILINSTSDFEYLRFVLSQLIIWLTAFFIVHLHIACKVDTYTIIRLVVYAVLIQSFLTILINTNATANERLLGIIVNDNEDLLEAYVGRRFIGWGKSFFSAGVLNGLGLICISFLLIKGKAWPAVITAAIYSVILGVGILLARTTLIGCAISILYFILDYKKIENFSIVLKFFLWLIFYVFLLLTLAFTVLDERMLEWALELFFNFIDSGSVETSSTNVLADMYIFPSQLSTYIIGDGLFSDLVNGGYYMGTDVGFLRLLFYFGVFGMLSIFCWHFHIVKLIKKSCRELYIFAIVVSLYCIVLNSKGITDMLFILILIYLHSLNSNHKILSTN